MAPEGLLTRFFALIRREGWRGLTSRLRRRLGARGGEGPSSSDDTERYRRRLEEIESRSPAIEVESPLEVLVLVTPSAGGSSVRATVDSLTAQTYPQWELRPLGPGVLHKDDLSADRRVTGEPASGTSGGLVALVEGGGVLRPPALAEMAAAFREDPWMTARYCDEDSVGPDGGVDPFFKPQWSPDLMGSFNYVGGFSVYRAEVFERETADLVKSPLSANYALMMSAGRQGAVGRLAEPLYRAPPAVAESLEERTASEREVLAEALRRAQARGGPRAWVEDGLVEGHHRARYEIEGEPLVSIVIPTRDRGELLRSCIASIEEKTSYERWEVLVVDNDSREPETLEYLATFGHRVVPHAGEFNFPEIVNAGAAEAAGDYVLLLNNDTEVISEDWIEAMLEHAQRPEIGAVGARLFLPDGGVQHEGIMLGLRGAPAANLDHQGYHHLGDSVRNLSAVTAACMMLRREVFREAGGLDPSLAMAYNDVDLCLRLRRAGYEVLYTPYARLYHRERSSRGDFTATADVETMDDKRFRARWGHLGLDPYYNPNLDPERPFRLAG